MTFRYRDSAFHKRQVGLKKEREAAKPPAKANPEQKKPKVSFKAKKRNRKFQKALKEFRASDLYRNLSSQLDAVTMEALEGYIVLFKTLDPQTVVVAGMAAELLMLREARMRDELHILELKHGVKYERSMNPFNPPKSYANDDNMRILTLAKWMRNRGGASDPAKAWRGAFVRKMNEVLPKQYATIAKLAPFAGLGAMKRQTVTGIIKVGRT